MIIEMEFIKEYCISCFVRCAHNNIHISVKPTIVLQGDRTPEMTDDENNEDLAPTGDLATLTANVCEGMPTDEDFPDGSCSRSLPYRGKGKGVGKGNSGSSGPPKKRSKSASNDRVQVPSQTKQATQITTEAQAENSDEVAATQTITVGSKRGYSYYPAYLFDVPPKN